LNYKEACGRRVNVNAKLAAATVAQEKATKMEHVAIIQAGANVEAMVVAQAMIILNGQTLLNSALARSVSSWMSMNKPPWASLVQGHKTVPSRFSGLRDAYFDGGQQFFHSRRSSIDLNTTPDTDSWGLGRGSPQEDGT
jgi:hypothetical protein